jgi:RNA polymerase sigma-70 factor (ECF subfamily)
MRQKGFLSGYRYTPDETDFIVLLQPHFEHLYRIAYRFTGAVDRAEDLIQDLLVRLYPRARELAAIEQLRPWLVRVMHRLFIDNLRRYTRSPVVPIEDVAGGSGGDTGDAYAEVADHQPGPEHELERALAQQSLLRAWEHLSVEHRTMLTLHDIEGYTLAELEVTLETPVGTLKSRLHRARARLRELLVTEPFGSLERVSGQKAI